MHTQTITKPKPARPVAGLGKGAAYNITDREHFLLSRFSNRCDELGLKSVSIGKGPFGVGCRLQLSSPNHNYELLLNGSGNLLLGRVENNGQRVKLHEGGTNTEAQWESVLVAIKQSEGR